MHHRQEHSIGFRPVSRRIPKGSPARANASSFSTSRDNLFWRACLARIFGITVVALLSGLCSRGAIAAEPEVPVSTQPQPTKVELESWRKATVKTPRPNKACFMATYPEIAWHEVACKPPSQKLYPPRRGGAIRPETVGGANSTDFSAQVTGYMSEAEGSFDSVTGVTSECSVPCDSATDVCPANPTCSIAGAAANAYSLQLNTNTFSTTACKTLHAPASGKWGKCQGWQQFVYDSDGSGGSIQYWLVPYGPKGSTCPLGWGQFSYSATPTDPDPPVYCYNILSPSNPAPAATIASLQAITVTGSAAGLHAADDTLTITVGSMIYSSPGENLFPDLDKQWNVSEFNIFGNGNNSQAVFNNGSTIVVRNSVDSGTTSAPKSDEETYTGETNNLTLVCTPMLETGTSTAWPSIKFAESNFNYFYQVNGLTEVNGKLVYLSASPDSTSVWGINAAGEVWQYLGAVTKKKSPWQQVVPRKFQQISLGADFVVWGVNSSADIYQYVYKTGSQGAWKLQMAQDAFPLPNTPGAATWIVSGAVTAAPDKTVWALMTAESVSYPAAPPSFFNLLYRWTGKTFKLISSPLPMAWISVGSATNVWALDQAGNIYSYTGRDKHPWNSVPGKQLTAISAAADGTVWGINSAGQAWTYTGPPPPKAPSKDSDPWRHIPGPGNPLAQISVGSQISVWALDAEGRAYSFSSTDKSWTSWNSSPQCPLGLGNLALTSISALAVSGAWGLNRNTGQIWGFNTEP